MRFLFNYKNKIPVQKIIRVSIINLFLNYSLIKKKKLIYKIKKILHLNKHKFIFIGRARTSIFLLINYFKTQQQGKYILISPFTVPAIINLIIKAGCIPSFLDFEEGSTSLKFTDLKEKVKKLKPLALIITHYHINEQNYEKICNYCIKKKVKIVEDCAISYVGKGKNTRINTLSDASFFSFSSFKAINFYYGGAISSRDQSLIEYIDNKIINWKKLNFFDYFAQCYKTHIYEFLTSKLIYNLFTHSLLVKKIYQKKPTTKNYFSSSSIEKNYFKKPTDGFYKEIDKKIENYYKIISHRRKIAKIYFKYLKNISIIPKNFKTKDIDNNSFNFYLIKHKESKKIREHLILKGHSVGKNYYENCSYVVNGRHKTPNLDNLIKHLLILPTHSDITPGYAKKISLEIQNFIKNSR